MNRVRKMPEYHIWDDMISRCYRPTSVSYKNYGARGISVCDRWRKFIYFYEDLGPRPSPELTLERIDNEGNYEPSNVRWATTKEQHRNKRTNVWLEFREKRMILADWATELGIKPNTLAKRLRHYSKEIALTHPRCQGGGVPLAGKRTVVNKPIPIRGDNHKHLRSLTVNGVTHSYAEWEKLSGIKYQTIFMRLKRGWPPDSALQAIQTNNGINYTKNRKARAL